MYAVAGHEAYHIKHKHQLVTCLGEIYLPLQIGTSSYKMSGKLLQHLLSSSLKEKRWMRSLIR
jgi:Zn-dependent protease with chaperone function